MELINRGTVLYNISYFIAFFFKFKKKYFIIFISIIAILSLFVAQWGGNLKLTYPFIEKEILFFNQSSLTNFFLPFGRIWELIIGILISFYIKKNGQPNYYNQIFSLIGIVLILYSIFTFTKETNYPSFQTLFPTVGTALIIIFTNKNTLAFKLFSQKILVFFGLISYSAYLYHYPIFTFVEYSNFIEFNNLNKIFLIFLTFILSYLSWKFIEKPFRKKSIISSKNFYFFLGLLYSLVLILFVITNNNKGFKSRFDKDFENFSINFNIKELEEETSVFKDELRKNDGFANDNKKKILIIGNSVAVDLLMVFDQNKELFNDYEFKEYYFKLENLFENSQKNKINLNKLIESELFINADVLMISTLYNEYETSFIKNNIIKLLYDITAKHGKLLVVTSNSPVFYDDRGINPILSILLKNKKNKISEIELNKLYYEKLNSKFIRIGKKVKQFTNELDIIFLNKFDYSCSLNEKSCDALTDKGNLIYFDGIHYTKKGAKYFGKKMHKLDWLEPVDKYYKKNK